MSDIAKDSQRFNWVSEEAAKQFLLDAANNSKPPTQPARGEQKQADRTFGELTGKVSKDDNSVREYLKWISQEGSKLIDTAISGAPEFGNKVLDELKSSGKTVDEKLKLSEKLQSAYKSAGKLYQDFWKTNENEGGIQIPEKFSALKTQILQEPLDSKESQTRAAEMVAVLLLEGGAAGKEAVSQIRRSLHFPAYQLKLEGAVQDGKALAAILESQTGEEGKKTDMKHAWQALETLDKSLSRANEAASAPEPDMKLAISSYSQALKISPKATDIRLPYLSGKEQEAFEQARKQVLGK